MSITSLEIPEFSIVFIIHDYMVVFIVSNYCQMLKDLIKVNKKIIK